MGIDRLDPAAMGDDQRPAPGDVLLRPGEVFNVELATDVARKTVSAAGDASLGGDRHAARWSRPPRSPGCGSTTSPSLRGARRGGAGVEPRRVGRPDHARMAHPGRARRRGRERGHRRRHARPDRAPVRPLAAAAGTARRHGRRRADRPDGADAGPDERLDVRRCRSARPSAPSPVTCSAAPRSACRSSAGRRSRCCRRTSPRSPRAWRSTCPRCASTSPSARPPGCACSPTCRGWRRSWSPRCRPTPATSASTPSRSSRPCSRSTPPTPPPCSRRCRTRCSTPSRARRSRPPWAGWRPTSPWSRAGSTSWPSGRPPTTCRTAPPSARPCGAAAPPAVRPSSALQPLVGLELRPRRLRDAANLWAALESDGGVAARDGAWAHPDVAPTAADLDDPLGYVERVAAPAAATTLDAALDADPARGRVRQRHRVSGPPADARRRRAAPTAGSGLTLRDDAVMPVLEAVLESCAAPDRSRSGPRARTLLGAPGGPPRRDVEAGAAGAPDRERHRARRRGLEHVLLTLHRKAGVWFQFGGHYEPADVDRARGGDPRGPRGVAGSPTWSWRPASSSCDRHALVPVRSAAAVEHLDLRFAAVVARRRPARRQRGVPRRRGGGRSRRLPDTRRRGPGPARRGGAPAARRCGSSRRVRSTSSARGSSTVVVGIHRAEAGRRSDALEVAAGALGAR